MFETLLKSIKPDLGVYGVLGNHDRTGRGSKESKEDFFSRSGIILLRDSVVFFGDSFAVAGRNDNRSDTRKSSGELLSNIPEYLPVILIDHRPTEIDKISISATDVPFPAIPITGSYSPSIFISKKFMS